MQHNKTINLLKPTWAKGANECKSNYWI